MCDDFQRSGRSIARTLAQHVVSGFKERGSAVRRWAYFPNFTPHLYESSGSHFMFWETLRSDLRHTIRLAIKTPVFSTLTVLALALGIGATSAIFAVVNGVLLQSLPYRDDGRLVNIWSFNTKENLPRNPISPPSAPISIRSCSTSSRSTRRRRAITKPRACRPRPRNRSPRKA
jgi:hypothetical protein